MDRLVEGMGSFTRHDGWCKRSQKTKKICLNPRHTLLTVIYHVLKDHKEYKELGGDYFDRQAPERLQRYLINRLEALGNEVTIRPRTTDHNE